MRVRKRYAVMLAIAALIGGVVIFQAVTAKPPEPYVEIAGWPNPPRMHFECRERGEEWVVYTNGRGETSAQTTGNLCDPRERNSNNEADRRR